MPILKPNEVICHECGKVMEYDKYRTPMRNGAYYHLDCLGNRASIMDVFFYSFAPLFEGIDEISEILKEIAKDDNDIYDHQEE